MCNHGTCQKIRDALTACSFRGNPGVFGLVCSGEAAFVLGYELYGKYAGQLSLPGGGMNPEDGGCYLETLRRELAEEMKHFGKWAELDSVFKLEGGFDYRIHKSGERCSVIFLGIHKGDLQKLVDECNVRITSDNDNLRLNQCQRELDYVEVVRVGGIRSAPVSRFAEAVINRL